jgi:hypothetical protein
MARPATLVRGRPPTAVAGPAYCAAWRSLVESGGRAPQDRVASPRSPARRERLPAGCASSAEVRAATYPYRSGRTCQSVLCSLSADAEQAARTLPIRPSRRRPPGSLRLPRARTLRIAGQLADARVDRAAHRAQPRTDWSLRSAFWREHAPRYRHQAGPTLPLARSVADGACGPNPQETRLGAAVSPRNIRSGYLGPRLGRAFHPTAPTKP